MTKAMTVFRVLLGLIFVIFGLNGFYTFIPVPPMPTPASNFMGALISTGYMLYFWKAFEVVGGLLLLTNNFVPFALAILSPVILNIFFFHLFLDPANFPLGGGILVLELLLLWGNRESFRPLFKRKAR